MRDTNKRIERIFLPFFANEIDMIAQAIISLKGFQYSENAQEIYRYFHDLHQCYIGLKNGITPLRKTTDVVFIAQGSNVGRYLECLNPSLNSCELKWISNIDFNSFFENIDRLFVKDFANKLKAYFALSRGTKKTESTYPEVNPSYGRLQDLWIVDSEDNTERQAVRTNFMLSFLIENILLFSSFNAVPDLEKAELIKKQFQKTSHDVCVVLMVYIYGQNVLLTSDASIRVFERLIREKQPIQAKYMKAPHHGSFHNINRDILNAVQPEVVIISHGNRKFGKSKDSHPNVETLKLLSSMNIRVLSTHDIVKGNVTIFSKECQKSFLEKDTLIEIE